MKPSDSKFLSKLLCKTKPTLTRDELYRACIYGANSGSRRIEESHLDKFYEILLQSRRNLALGNNQIAMDLLTQLDKLKCPHYLTGDAEFLRGINAQRTGNLRAAQQHMTQASQIFQQHQESHRFLRSAINAQIYGQNYESFVQGDLFSFRQICMQKGYLDLVGNIQKGCAVELLNHGKWKEAEVAARDAISNYEKEGSPDDLAVAYCIAAISELLGGQRERAGNTVSRVLLNVGKISEYLEVYQKLVLGKVPKLSQNHPLSNTPWKTAVLKVNSITGKIIRKLQCSKATRDELISEIWGPRAIHASYRDRLYSAIKEIRRKRLAEVVFDGAHYGLGQDIT